MYYSGRGVGTYRLDGVGSAPVVWTGDDLIPAVLPPVLDFAAAQWMLAMEDDGAHREGRVRRGWGLALAVTGSSLEVAPGCLIDPLEVLLVVGHPGVDVLRCGPWISLPQQGVNREVGPSSEQQFVGGEPGGVVGRRVVGE